MAIAMHIAERCFNPRPSSLTGEPYNYGRKGDDGKFQSTPVITDGRTHSFNPFSKERGVSIHARHH